MHAFPEDNLRGTTRTLSITTPSLVDTQEISGAVLLLTLTAKDHFK